MLLKGDISRREAYEKTKEESQRRAKKYGNSTIQYWLESCIDVDYLDEMPNPQTKPASYLKTPLLWSLYYLKHDYSFESAIKDIITKKGDTTNNAAIVGALLGAAYGIEGMPSELVDKVLKLDTKRGIYSPKGSLEQMIKIAIENPEELEVVWDQKTLKGQDVVDQCKKEAEGV